ncbi:putative nicotinate phosphoribosyltransferase [Phocoenobacter uteri]|uniref:Nicotinamide phosphoribosyltransferase n=1 Tax=Phocoenobacter uteri TaxID=146806 RepID=A0A379CC05_9PAST|nr:nicotinate phosphoribosyltransferase [Phocoenobacter uteri]MDG6881638.1 nicotinate phosphoribosyltransferase [Phocoenobacter uteri]SUB59669.1 putative nicotinate phosphoribosyltransferase [Phocoenobacter uteri]
MYTSNLNNLILNTDSYKASHWVQYPPQSEYVSSYIESRKSDFDVVFFGLQAFIKEYLSKPVTLQDIEEAEIVFTAHGEPFNKQGWLKIVEKYQGYLPIKIEAIPEGSIIPASNVVCQIINTDPEFYWLPSYLETALLRAIWYPSTVASISYYCKKIIKQALEKSADNLASLPFKLHDFGARGASSLETVALGGLAHLVNFSGTDSVSALLAARRWYNATEMPAFSIPAAEHSTITSWGREGEIAAYQNMLNQFGGEGKIFAVVSDSYNLWDVVSEVWGSQFKEQIIKMGGTLVVRPDSGKPTEVVCKTLEILEQKFGSTLNSKGYKVLPDCIRVIQGDGIDQDSLKEILDEIMAMGFSAENITFGMGGGLLQKVNRDVMSWVMKTSAIQVAGEWRDVYKDPITAHSKRSKKGRLALIKQDNQFKTIREETLLDAQQNLLQAVYLNGKLLIEEEFTTIRNRTSATL